MDEASESGARRAARKVGLVARKSRRRQDMDNRGEFQILDPTRNWIVRAEKFDLSPDHVCVFCRAREGI